MKGKPKNPLRLCSDCSSPFTANNCKQGTKMKKCKECGITLNKQEIAYSKHVQDENRKGLCFPCLKGEGGVDLM